MVRFAFLGVLAVFIIGWTSAVDASQTRVVVKTEHVSPGKSTWAFQKIEGPSRCDVGQLAIVSTIQPLNRRSQKTTALNDGRVQLSGNDLSESVFFAKVDDAGVNNVLMDFRSVMPVVQINSFSWQEGSTDSQGARAPQVYALYGSAAAAPKINDPSRSPDWVLIAEVDTRPNKTGKGWGGQYGVRIRADSELIGKYRYLLWVTKPTLSPLLRTPELTNTLYGEFDVHTTYKLNPPIGLEGTELFFRHEAKLCQAVLAEIEDTAGATIVVTSDAGRQVLQADRLPRFMNRLVIPVPPREKPQKVQVEVQGADLRGVGTVDLHPSRQWTVYIIPHTHLDIGFTDLQERIWERQARNLDGVIELCRKTADWPDGSQFYWTIEEAILFENFARRYPQERVNELVELIRAGRVELTGFWANLLTELAGPEGLIRATYSGRRLSERYKLQVDTMMIDDVPGYTWALPQLCSAVGIRYANLRAGNRNEFVWDRPGAVPRLFRWQSPDGSQLVCWYTDSYREANFMRKDFPAVLKDADMPAEERMLFQNISAHLRRAERAGYPRDITQLRMGGDNLTAVESVCRWVRYWNDRWAYPRLRIATSRQFFQAIDDGKQDIPVFAGDIPDPWADGATTSAEQTGQARVGHDQTVELETLYSLPGGPITSPEPNRFAKIHAQLLLYVEHTWGASGIYYDKNPEQEKGQWAVKRGYVDTACKDIAAAWDHWKQAVARWAKPARDSIIVWNTLSWPRSDVVEMTDVDLPSDFSLRSPDGKLIPVQKSGENGWRFIAQDVPPLGYALYEIEKDKHENHVPEESLYEIDFDPARGAIRQIHYRPTGRNLLDASPRFAFNQYVYESGTRDRIDHPHLLQKQRSPADKTIVVSDPARLIERINGPVFKRIVTRTRGRLAPVIEQSYTTYGELNRIDIANRVEKIATLDAEGVYFAFPFEVKSPQCRLEIPFTCMRPGIDQLRYSAADFYSVYHWVELWNKTGGLLWASVEAPVVVFNDLWPECWHDETQIENGLFFSYVMSNFWWANYCRQQGGDLTFRYSLRTYDGEPDRVRSFRFGHEVGTPLFAQVVHGKGGQMPPKRSWFSVEPNHVVLLNVKRAENGAGWIARLLELGGGDCTARLVLPKVEWSASVTDHAERGRKPLQVADDGNKATVDVPVLRSRFVTLRLEEGSVGQ